MAFFNPFAHRETHSDRCLLMYRVWVPLTWFVAVLFSVYYSIRAPADVEHGHTIPRQAEKHITAFSQNLIVTGIYWILLFLSQLSYVWHLFSKDAALVTAAANVASHFILNNLFVLAWVLLWVRNHFVGSEVILAAHFINQHICYRHNRTLPAFVHLPAVAGPYAWALTALFWNGAIAVSSNSLAARIVANVFIWVIFVIGVKHIVHDKDYMFGYCLSFLTFSLALEQLFVKVISLQWIFAFVIFGVFTFLSLYIASTKFYQRDSLFRRIVDPESTDRERQPLLDEQQ